MYKSSSFLIFLITFVLFITSASSIFASSTDKIYFGITGTESSQAHLDALDVKTVYTWAQGGYAPNNSNYTSFLTLRLGYYWWNFQTQNFLSLANPDTNNCNKPFPHAVNGVTFQYNECTLDTRIVNLVAAASNQPIKYFVIGNEPNMYGNNDSDGSLPPLSGWDASNTSLLASYHAAQYKIIYNRLQAYKDANPTITIKIVGPSIIGFGSSMNNGTAWFTAFKNAYGSTPPMDYLNFHAYNTKVVNNKRSLNSTEVFDDLNAFRSGMNSNGYTGKEIFITEFGVLNDCSGCSASSVESIKTYLNELITGFRVRRTTSLLKGWMLFSYPGVNPVSLFNSNGTLTAYGEFYKRAVAQIFDDINPMHWAFIEIQSLYNNNITYGYAGGTGPLGRTYGPTDLVPRDQMAVFLSRAKGLAPVVTGQVFCDVTSSSFGYGEIQAIYYAGITLGSTSACPQGRVYNPSQLVPRDQMAIFIARALDVAPLYPYTNFVAPTTPSFTDVPTNHSFYKAIEFAKAKNITQGCTLAPAFCPSATIPRDQMAVFLYNAFLRP